MWVRVEDSDYFCAPDGRVKYPSGKVTKPPSGRFVMYFANDRRKYCTVKTVIAQTVGPEALKLASPDSLQGEEWREHSRHRHYLVSNRGRVWRKARVVANGSRLRSPGLVAPHLDKDGYVIVNIDGRNLKTHRLVYEVWIGRIPKGAYVLHRNGVTIDNLPDNLALGDPAKNHEDRRRHGTQFWGHTSPSSKLTRKQVIRLRAQKDMTSAIRLGRKYDAAEWVVEEIINETTYREDERMKMAKSLRRLIEAELTRKKLHKGVLESLLKRREHVYGITSAELRQRIGSYVSMFEDLRAQPGLELYLAAH